MTCCCCDCEGLTDEEEVILKAAREGGRHLRDLADRIQMGLPIDHPLWMELRLLADSLDPRPSFLGEYQKRIADLRAEAALKRRQQMVARVANAFEQAVLAGKGTDDALGDAWRAA